MFGPDYICIAAALAMLATIPVVAAWPEKRYGPAADGRKRKLPSTILYPSPKEETKR